ncbi:MAG: hypothetical protein KY469_04705 [Actinobacteria bacterium]|nr:hypothetical protein [Actinomycetota bacterium]
MLTGGRRARLLVLPWALLLLWPLAVPALSTSHVSITLTPDSDTVGSTITIDGRGFSREAHERNTDQVTFRFRHPSEREGEPLLVENLRWLGDDAFTGTFDVPDLPADPSVSGYKVEASQFGQLNAEADFLIIPTLDIAPSRGAAADRFTLSGTGWDLDARFAFEIRLANGGALPAPYDAVKNLTPQGALRKVGRSGFSADFVIPALPAAEYLIEASQFRRELIQQVPLEVLATLELDPGAGPTGLQVTASATGFDRPEALNPNPGEQEGVLLLFDGDVVGAFPADAGAAPWTTNTTWELAFDVPTRPPGRYRVVACQRTPPNATNCNTNRIIAAATFTVAPVSIFADPTSGVGGTTTTVSGAGWNRNEDLQIDFDGDTVVVIDANTTISSTGAFDVDINIPDVVADPYAIRACQQCGTPNEVSAEVIFTVLPSLQVAPALNQPGAETVARGTGWDHDVQLNLFVGDVEVAVLAPDSPSFQGTTAMQQAFLTPSLPAGEYEVRACQRCNTATEREAVATIRVIPAIELFPPLGPPGFVTFVQGDGFPANAEVILGWEPGLGTFQLTTGPDGRFRAPLHVMRNDVHGPRLVQARLPANEALPEEDRTLEPTARFLVVPGSAQPGEFQYRR